MLDDAEKMALDAASPEQEAGVRKAFTGRDRYHFRVRLVEIAARMSA